MRGHSGLALDGKKSKILIPFFSILHFQYNFSGQCSPDENPLSCKNGRYGKAEKRLRHAGFFFIRRALPL